MIIYRKVGRNPQARNLLEEFSLWHIKLERKQNNLDRKGQLWTKRFRELIYVYHEQEGYLKITQECNFEAADKFRSMESGNNEFG